MLLKPKLTFDAGSPDTFHNIFSKENEQEEEWDGN
jgi:hypothetical protein